MKWKRHSSEQIIRTLKEAGHKIVDLCRKYGRANQQTMHVSKVLTANREK